MLEQIDSCLESRFDSQLWNQPIAYDENGEYCSGPFLRRLAGKGNRSVMLRSRKDAKERLHHAHSIECRRQDQKCSTDGRNVDRRIDQQFRSDESNGPWKAHARQSRQEKEGGKRRHMIK